MNDADNDYQIVDMRDHVRILTNLLNDFEYNPFHIQRSVRGILKKVALSLLDQDAESLYRIAEQYSNTAKGFGTLLMAICKIEQFLREILRDVCPKDAKIVDLHLSEDGRALAIAYEEGSDRNEVTFGGFIRRMREDGEHVPHLVDKLIRDYEAQYGKEESRVLFLRRQFDQSVRN